jgi:predicted ATPase/Tfp pilus assembly protein PilF
VGLDPLSLWCDATALEVLLRNAATPPDRATLVSATTLYGGEFLADLALPGAEMFDEWVRAQRVRLHTLAVGAFRQLAMMDQQQGAYATAISTLHRLLQLEPWDERAHRALMTALAADGQRSAALTQYALCCQLLADELGVAPSAETRALADQLRGTSESTAARSRLVATAATRTHNLPAPLTSLIGREGDLAHLTTLVGDTRLVTLVGTGGIGKTRLALAAAWALRDTFASGAWWVALTGLPAGEDPAHERTTIVSAAAAALGFVLRGQQIAPDELAEILRDRATLLVLDNAEHLQETAPVVRTLLEAAPNLHILVTSRAPLGLTSESILRLDGLSVPPEHATDPATAAATRLFLARATQHTPGWDGATEMAGVVRLVRILEGLPLGIELAARWVGHYRPEEIATAIARDPDFLIARTHDTPERHRSLRAIFDYTWGVLSPEERRTLAQLTIFHGTFDREAALRVTDATVASLAALVDRSLLRQAGIGRYNLHELLRQFAAAQLDASGNAAQLGERHATYFLELAERAATELIGPEQGAWGAQLDHDLNNLRAALTWARQQGATTIQMRLVGALGRFWLDRGYLTEGRDWLEETVGATSKEEPTPLIRARALHAAGIVANSQGDQEQAHTWLEASIALYELAGERLGVVRALNTLGGVAFDSGDLDRSMAHYRRCLALAQALGDRGELARVLGNMGEVLVHRGEFTEATRQFERALALAREAGRRDVEAYLLGDLGNAAYHTGDTTKAVRFHQQALELKAALGQRRQIATTLEDLTKLLVAEGAGAQAARLLGAATALRAQIGSPQPVPERRATETVVAPVRAALGEQAWSRAFKAGQTLPLDAVIAELIGQLTP